MTKIEEMTKEELLEMLNQKKEKAKAYIKNYQQTTNGREKYVKASKKYYDKNREKILEKKREYYLKKKKEKQSASNGK